MGSERSWVPGQFTTFTGQSQIIRKRAFPQAFLSQETGIQNNLSEQVFINCVSRTLENFDPDFLSK